MSLLGQAMGNQRARHARDLYPTIDPRCVAPLMELMLRVQPIRPKSKGWIYGEPCAGAGDLIHLLRRDPVVCAWASDIEPQRRHIARQDALLLTQQDLAGLDCLITNFPWRRDLLHPLIKHLAPMIPVYTLLDAGWMSTGGATQLGDQYCTDIITCRRLKWFDHRTLDIDAKLWRGGAQPVRFKKPNDPSDDTHWYRFGPDKDGPTRWHWPVAKESQEQRRLI